MINKMEIKLVNYVVIIENETCYINNKEIKLNDNDIDNIIRIIRNWNSKYTNKEIISEKIDYINIFENNKKYTYLFDGNYPIDINKLIFYIGDMYAR